MRHYSLKYARDLREFKDPLLLPASKELVSHLVESVTPEPIQPPRDSAGKFETLYQR
jgi:hypothetical protein